MMKLDRSSDVKSSVGHMKKQCSAREACLLQLLARWCGVAAIHEFGLFFDSQQHIAVRMFFCCVCIDCVFLSSIYSFSLEDM